MPTLLLAATSFFSVRLRLCAGSSSDDVSELPLDELELEDDPDPLRAARRDPSLLPLPLLLLLLPLPLLLLLPLPLAEELPLPLSLKMKTEVRRAECL
mmetsp:Transcript_37655/g.94667  ORF Transcript_37655/g.94667 Transcript_37655/m.94667 type:complete len:98 (-) Transcript_37655:73-366(-)